MTLDVTHLWACDKAILRIGITTQRKQTNKKNANSQLNRKVFLAGTDSKIKLFKYYIKKDKNWTKL